MRILEQAKIEYSCHEYEYDENDLDGHHVADYLKIPYEEVFKTLVARSDKGEYLVFCLSVDDEVDFKKAARLAGVKCRNDPCQRSHSRNRVCKRRLFTCRNEKQFRTL